MTKIVSCPNCGNSPKMEFLKQFKIAFAEGRVEFLMESVTDDVVWDMIGERKIEGKEEFERELEKRKEEKVTELILHQIVSHGKEGAANGILTLQNGNRFAFSDFYQFRSAKGKKVKLITSYKLEI